MEKPAHTSAELLLLEPRMLLDDHTYLDHNSYLADSTLRLNYGPRLGPYSILSELKDEHFNDAPKTDNDPFLK
ncbi:hypothetical protein D3C71_2167700 [compost metagenome]